MKGGKMRHLPLVVAVIAAACGSPTPTTPTPTPAPVVTPTPTAPTTAIISGRVTATNGGQALDAIAVTIGPQTVTSDAGGGFSFVFPPFQDNQRVTLAGPGILTRLATATVSSTRSLPLDAISLSGGFDQNYYRQLVRNTLDAPTTMEPLRRWTVNPSFYMKVTDETGVMMDSKTLDNTEQVIRAFVPQWTGGKLGVAAFERGTSIRALASGWMNVNWSNQTLPATSGSGILCGFASTIGGNPSTLTFYYKASQNQNIGQCRCPGQSEMGSRVVSHELGHAMGFWHAGAVNDVMFPGTGNYCDATLSARERYHAAIAYSRPVGNRDPDDDSQTSVVLSLPRVTIY
jgi:hypothetical protein